jgi:hypothetical protein
MMALLGAAGCASPVQEANTTPPPGTPICEADCGGAYTQYPALTAAPSLTPSDAGTALLAELSVDQGQSVTSISMELYDAAGNLGGSGTLTYDGSDRWSGTLALAANAPPGSYTPEVIINIGRYDVDPEVIQSIYLYDAISSEQFYLVANNRIVYEPGRVTLHLARTAVSTIPLNAVTLGGN